MHFDRYQPEQRRPLSPQQLIAADRSDVATDGSATSQPDLKAHFEDSGAAKMSGSEDAGGGVDIKIDSVEQVFAMFADSRVVRRLPGNLLSAAEELSRQLVGSFVG